MGRPTQPIVLTEDEPDKLQQWARRLKTSQRLALRARIVLGCADGMENRQVARQPRITDQTVCKWRERFRRARLEGLPDEPRLGAPRQITDAQVEALITRTLEADDGKERAYNFGYRFSSKVPEVKLDMFAIIAALREERGEDLIEYALIMILMTVASIVIFIAAGGSIQQIWNATKTN
jgi:transposase